jgi:hypothetical protein
MKLSNIMQMYEAIYVKMVDVNIASLIENPVDMDCEGMRWKRVRGLDWIKILRSITQITYFLQMKAGVKQTRSRMEMLAIESTSSNRALHLKSSAALLTTGSLFFPLLEFRRSCLLCTHFPAQRRRRSHEIT